MNRRAPKKKAEPTANQLFAIWPGFRRKRRPMTTLMPVALTFGAVACAILFAKASWRVFCLVCVVFAVLISAATFGGLLGRSALEIRDVVRMVLVFLAAGVCAVISGKSWRYFWQ